MESRLQDDERSVAFWQTKKAGDPYFAQIVAASRARRLRFDDWTKLAGKLDPTSSSRLWGTFNDEPPPIDGPPADPEFSTLIIGTDNAMSSKISPVYANVRHRHTVRVTKDNVLVTNYDSGDIIPTSTGYDAPSARMGYISNKDFGNACGHTAALGYHKWTDVSMVPHTANSTDTRAATSCEMEQSQGGGSPPNPPGGGGGGDTWCLYYVIFSPSGTILSQTEVYCWEQ